MHDLPCIDVKFHIIYLAGEYNLVRASPEALKVMRPSVPQKMHENVPLTIRDKMAS